MSYKRSSIIHFFIGIVFFLYTFIGVNVVIAQNSSSVNKGHITIINDSKIDSLVKQHIEINKKSEGIDGFRVQIFFDAGNNALEKARALAQQFQTLYPTETAYVSYAEPYYRVRAGNFRTRLEAQGFLQKIKYDFPNAFIIKDKVIPPVLE